MKIVFLDVDGELTYSNYENENTANIDIEKVKLLKEICDRTGAKVVISSSWRGTENYTPKIYNVLIHILTNYGIKILDELPYIKTEFKENISNYQKEFSLDEIPLLHLKYGTGRAAEIQKWLQEHHIDNFVILDDEDWNWSDYGYDTRWVQPTCFGNGGLKREHVDRAIEILNEHNKK